VTIEIKGPCPFCGGDDLYVREIYNMICGSVKYSVSCDTCGTRGPEGFNEQNGILLWNQLRADSE